jgi:hypothetical protein
MLSFYSYLPRNPPGSRIVKEKCLDDGLNVVDENVVSSDMGKLVHENQFELGRAQSCQRAGGQEDDGTQPSHHTGHTGDG